MSWLSAGWFVRQMSSNWYLLGSKPNVGRSECAELRRPHQHDLVIIPTHTIIRHRQCKQLETVTVRSTQGRAERTRWRSLLSRWRRTAQANGTRRTRFTVNAARKETNRLWVNAARTTHINWHHQLHTATLQLKAIFITWLMYSRIKPNFVTEWDFNFEFYFIFVIQEILLILKCSRIGTNFSY